MDYENYLGNGTTVSDLEARQAYAKRLFLAFKIKNIGEGIQWFQGLKLHELMRKYKVTYPEQLGGEIVYVDIINILVAGDLDLGCLALQYGEVQDMSSPFHWFSQERKDWLVGQLKKFLGWP